MSRDAGTSFGLALGAGVIACGLGLAGSAHAWTLEEAAAPYKGVTIRAIGEALPPLEAMNAMKHEFEERTGIEVVIEMYEHSEAVNKVMLDLNSRRGRYDFILQPHRELGRFVENGHLVPLEKFMNDPKLRNPDFKPEEVLYDRLWHEISWYDGKMYGFPFTALTMYMWYRKDLAEDPQEKAGFKAKYGYELQPAQTWEQYRDLAEWFTRPDEGFYGTALQGKRHSVFAEVGGRVVRQSDKEIAYRRGLEEHVHHREAAAKGGLILGHHAAGKREEQAGPFFLEAGDFAQLADYTVFRRLAHDAGVEHDNVRGLDTLDLGVAARL